MQFEEQKIRRNAYSYPTVALKGEYTNPTIARFNTTNNMDNYIHRLLTSDNTNEILLGYLSVVFWGFYSGQDGVIRQERALGKVALARDGRDRIVKGKPQRMRGILDLGDSCVSSLIANAVLQVKIDDYSGALKILSELPQLQIAFSSKVCAFIDPKKCGVIDSVIVEKYPKFKFTTDDGGIVLNRVANRERYNDYCSYLQKQAQLINDSIPKCLWSDKDGKEYKWRALDVERSMY